VRNKISVAILQDLYLWQQKLCFRIQHCTAQVCFYVSFFTVPFLTFRLFKIILHITHQYCKMYSTV
jgi:hypothetical protein